MSNNRRTIFTPDRDLIVKGNLTVRGNTIVVSQDELRINDNVIIINNDVASPSSTLKMFSNVNGYGATITYAGANLLFSNTVQAGLYVPASETFIVEPDAFFSGNIAAQNFLGTITASNTANSFTAPITLNLTGDVVGNTTFQFAGQVANLSTSLSIDAVQLGAETTGNYVAQVTAGNGITVSGGISETANIEVSHYLPDFVAESASNINTGANVIQSLALDFDEFGHAANFTVSSIDLDDLYYRESEVDTLLGDKADKSTSISAGAGLFYSAGAGTLAANFTLAVGAGTGIISNPDNVAVTLSPFSTTDLAEGSNLYFTADRVRANISVSGDLTYDQANGVIGFVERTDQEVRDLFSATSNILYNANTGVISQQLTTDDITEGSNLYFTVDRVRSNISVSGDLTYDQANGVIGYVERTDQEIRDLFSAGNGLVYNSSVGEFSVNASQLVTVADNQTITGDKTFTGNVDLTGAITSVTSGVLPTVNTTTWIYTLGSNDSTIANTQYVETAVENRIQSLISGSPEVLDTLQEIADSLNNDPNLANTLTTLIATKADKTITLFGGDGVDVNSGNSADLSANITIDVDDTVVRTTGDQLVFGNKQFANNIVVSDIVLDVANNDGFVQITNNGANSSLPSMSFHDASYIGGEFVDLTTSQFQVSGTVRAGELEVAGAYTLPTADGSDGDVLTTLGNGVVVFKSGVTGNDEDATISGDRTFTGNVLLNGNTQVGGELTLNNTTAINGDVSMSALLETDNTITWYQDTLGSNINISISANSITFSGAADAYANGVGRAHEIDFGNTTIYIGSSDRKSIYTDGTDRTLEYLSVDSGIVLGPSRSNVLQDGAIYYEAGELFGVQSGNVFPLVTVALSGQIFTNDSSDAQPIKSLISGNYFAYGFSGGTNITVSEPGGNVVQIDGLSNAEIISVARSGITATGNITFDQNTGIISQGLLTNDISEGTNLFYTDERVDDRVANLIVAGSNIAVDYDDANNSLTIGVDLDGIITGVFGANGITGGGTSGDVTLELDANVAGDGLTFTSGVIDVVGGAGITVDADAIQLSNSGVTAGTYGSGVAVPQITVDQYGRITGAANANITVDNYVNWSFTTDTAGNVDVFSGNLVTIAGGNNIDIVHNVSTRTITISTPADITSVLAGDGISGGGVSGDVTVSLNPTVAGNGLIYTSGVLDVAGELSNISSILFDTSQSNTPDVGELQWNSTDGTLDLGMPGGNVVLQIGQETLVLSTNNTGNTIFNGTVVGLSGATNGDPLIEPLDVTDISREYTVLGMVTEDILDSTSGYVTHFGTVRDIDTSSFTAGTQLYVDPSNPGAVTASKPESPNIAIVVGTVLNQGAANGSVFVNLFEPDIASEVTYNNLTSGLTATNVQAAIDELQLEKASVDALSSTITIYPTTANSNISGYLKMVSTTDDPDYDDPAANVSTGTISGTGQLITSLASEPGLFVGNPGVISVTTLGNIRRTAGTGTAEFYFEIYQRNAAGTETLVGTSGTTSSVTQSTYAQFSAVSPLNNGNWLDTDRVVIKYYANRTGAGGDPTYDFQFGGDNPVRTLIPVPVSVIPASNAGNILVDTSNFDNKLSGADSTVQLALDTLDDHVHTTSEITEGSRLYYTNERVDDRVNALLQTTGNLQFTYDDGNGTLTLSESLTTDDVAEGSNLYYTDARVQEYLSNGVSNITILGNLDVSSGVVNLGNTVTQQIDAYNAGTTTPSQILDITPAANVSSIKYYIQAVSNTDTHVSELTVVHNSGSVFFSEFGIVHSGNLIYTTQADVTGGNIRVLVSPNAAAQFDLFKTVYKSST